MCCREEGLEDDSCGREGLRCWPRIRSSRSPNSDSRISIDISQDDPHQTGWTLQSESSFCRSSFSYSRLTDPLALTCPPAPTSPGSLASSSPSSIRPSLEDPRYYVGIS